MKDIMRRYREANDVDFDLSRDSGVKCAHCHCTLTHEWQNRGNNYCWVCLRRNPELTPTPVPVALTAKDKAVLSHICEGVCRLKAIAESTGIAVKLIHGSALKLRKAGLVELTGGGVSAVWTPTYAGRSRA